jgi:hypothetical protein
MNIQLRHEREFVAAFWNDDETSHQLITNVYRCRLKFLTQSIDQRDINVAVGRVLYMIDEEFSDTVFFSDRSHEIAHMFDHMGINVTTLPGPPVDQIIGMMLYCKLQAIMQGRVELQELEISSMRGNDVWYIHDSTESLGPFVAEGWWHNSDPEHCAAFGENQVVAKIQPSIWKNLDLDWPGLDRPDSQIVHVDFSRQ